MSFATKIDAWRINKIAQKFGYAATADMDRTDKLFEKFQGYALPENTVFILRKGDKKDTYIGYIEINSNDNVRIHKTTTSHSKKFLLKQQTRMIDAKMDNIGRVFAEQFSGSKPKVPALVCAS